MSRSGYSEDYDESYPNASSLYRNSVDSALMGKRGQAFLRDLLAALDDLPEKRLVAFAFEADGEVCALGAVGRIKGIEMPKGDFSDDDGMSVSKRALGRAFGIAPCKAAEIMFENDEGASYWRAETPEQRFDRMRAWVVAQLKAKP